MTTSCFSSLRSNVVFSIHPAHCFSVDIYDHKLVSINSPTQFSSVAQSCPTLCNSMNCSTPGLPVHHQLPEFTWTHVHLVGDAIQPSHLLLSPSFPTLSLSQHQGLFKWVSSLHQVAKVLAFQLQHQSFQWTLRTDQQHSDFQHWTAPLLKNMSSEKESPCWSLNWNFLFLECQKERLFSGQDFYKS